MKSFVLWGRGLLLGAAMLASGAAGAAVVPCALFSDGAVLQQKMPVPVFGTAGAGEKVTVSIGGQTVSTVAQTGGAWRVTLKPLKAGGPYPLTIVGPINTVTAQVLVGEVFVCSGQSNMDFGVGLLNNSQDVIAAATDPQLHLLNVPERTAATPQSALRAHWVACTPETVRATGNWSGFSAVGYFFGRDLRKALHVPVGLIQSSWGGTYAQAWTSLPALTANPALEAVFTDETAAEQKYPAALKAYQDNLPTLQANYQAALDKYKLDSAAAQNGTPPPAAPKPPAPPHDPTTTQNYPASIYNAMIAPLLPYAIKGVIWYQGEQNWARPAQYATLLPTLIGDWRKNWDEGNFPFLFVQLAPFNDIGQQPQDTAWAQLREAQRRTMLSVPNTAMTVIIDSGEAHNIHPKAKEPVGSRLALAALALAYGQKGEWSGPMYQSLTVRGGKVFLHFTHLGGGLVANPAGPLTGFDIAGADRKYVSADAQIVGDTVVVSSPQVTQPAAVRYGWKNYPVVNLGNKAGLPASPFETDPFPPAP